MEKEISGTQAVRDMVMDVLIEEGWGTITALEEANKWIRQQVEKGPGTYWYYSKRHAIEITIGGRS